MTYLNHIMYIAAALCVLIGLNGLALLIELWRKGKL